MAMAGTRGGDVRRMTTWRCRRCARTLGHVAGRTLHEPNGDRSALPVVRRCPDCGARNVKLGA